jgi:hypothetical protein
VFALRRSWLSELAGGLGDAGLFLPIAIAMVTLNGLGATAVFAGTGLVYVATALAFRVPIPVQPLKAFAASAIALGLSANVLVAGPGDVGCDGRPRVTGAADWLAKRFSLVLIRGIQAAVALLLARAAIELAAKGNWSGLPAIDPSASIALAAIACAVLFVLRDRRVPGTLLVLGAGEAVGLIVG